MRKRRLKKWNGLLIFHYDQDGKSFTDRPEYHRAPQLSVYVAAYSQKDALALLEEHGHPTSLYEFREWWNPGCWGNAMLPICPDRSDPPERGMWVNWPGIGPTLIESGKEVS